MKKESTMTDLHSLNPKNSPEKITVCFFSPYPPENDGISKYTERLVKNFPENVEISIFARRGNAVQGEYGVFRTLSFRIKDIIATYKKLTDLHPDVIHVQYTIPLYGFYLIVLLPLLVLARAGLKSKLVITFHEVKREIEILKFLGTLHYEIVSSLVNKIYVHTHEAKVILVKRCHVAEAKISVIPHGTFSLEASPNGEERIRKTFKIYKENIILFFGYIHTNKGIEFLVDAYSKLLLNHSLKETTQLLIVGSVRPRQGIFKIFGNLDAKYFEKIKTQIKARGIQDNVMLIDYVPDDLIYSFLKMASCIVLPYTRSEQSGVLNLAISTQTPIIASNIGGFGETLKDVGVLVKPGDSDAIAESLKEIIQNPGYAKKLSNGYLLLNDKLQPTEVVRVMMDDYRKLLCKE